jgi:hypothetical protein
MPTDYLVANTFFGIGVETTWGTPVVPGFWIPVMDPKWTTKLKWIADEAMYGSAAQNRDQVPGVRYDELSLKHSVYPDSIPNFMRAALGSADTVTGTGPYTHTIGLLNSPTTGSQPPSYTADYFDASQTRQLAGSRLNTFNMTFGADVGVEATTTWVCGPETDISLPTQSLSTAHLIPGWDMVFQLGTVNSQVIVSGELDIERNTEAIFTATGIQTPHNVFAGPISVKGKVTFVLESGDATFANSLVRAQQAAKLIFTDPVSAAVITFQMSALQFQNPVLNIGKKWLQIDADFSAVDNATDAITGLSPIKCIAVNSQSTAY